MSKILLDLPFFAAILLKRPVLADSSIPTACTDGTQIWYSPAFFSSLTIGEIEGVLCHEVLHITNLHHLREQGRDHDRWNQACDFAINLMLVDSRIKLPKGALLDEKYRDMSAEKIYELLEKEKSVKGTMIGEFKKPMNESGTAPMRASDEIDREIKRIMTDVNEALQIAKMRGRVPKGMERQLEIAGRSNMNWREKLSVFLNQQFKSDYSMSQPNTRYVNQGLYLPSVRSMDRGKFIFAFDTSGSICGELLNKFASELVEILNLASESLTLIHCDAAVAHVQELEAGDPCPRLEPKGGGGTDFIPVSKWIKENDVDASCLIYFTDGMCDSFAPDEEIPTLWVCSELGFNPPYGEVIYLDKYSFA